MPSYKRRAGSRRRYTPKRKAYKRTAYRRRRSNKNSAVTRNLTGFPSNRVVRMRYCDSRSFDLTSASQAVYGFRANSIYDPVYEVDAGHQPTGYLQWRDFYNQYTVLKSKITVKFAPITSGAGAPMIMGINLTNASDTAKIKDSIERGDMVYTMMASVAGNAQKPATLSRWYNPKQFWNLKDLKDNQQRIGALYNDNPPDTALFSVKVGPWNEGTDAGGTVQALVVIDYWVLLSEPQILASSS